MRLSFCFRLFYGWLVVSFSASLLKQLRFIITFCQFYRGDKQWDKERSIRLRVKGKETGKVGNNLEEGHRRDGWSVLKKTTEQPV